MIQFDADKPANIFLVGDTQMTSIRLGTANDSRIFIGGSSFANLSFVGIGNGFTNPQALLHVNGTVRIDELPEDETSTKLVVTDSLGNLKSRDIKDLETALAKIESLEKRIEKLEGMISLK